MSKCTWPSSRSASGELLWLMATLQRSSCISPGICCDFVGTQYVGNKVLRSGKQVDLLIRGPCGFECPKARYTIRKFANLHLGVYQNCCNMLGKFGLQEGPSCQSALTWKPEPIERWGDRHSSEKFQVVLDLAIGLQTVCSVEVVECRSHYRRRLQEGSTVWSRGATSEKVTRDCHFHPRGGVLPPLR